MTKFDAVRTQALILRQSARGSFKVISKDSGYLSKCGALRRQLPTKPGSRFGNEVALYVVSQRLLEQAGVEVGQETVAGLYTACPPLGGAGRHGRDAEIRSLRSQPLFPFSASLCVSFTPMDRDWGKPQADRQIEIRFASLCRRSMFISIGFERHFCRQTSGTR
jgi:hypothetical protein